MDRSRGILRLRHLQETTEAHRDEMRAKASRFHALAREDAAPRAVSSFNLFQTPQDIARRMVSAACAGRELGWWLEPSAGLGRIYRAIRNQTVARGVLVEVDGDLCRELWAMIDNDPQTSLIQRDFLAYNGGMFNSIIMNPPFKQGLDIKHITHALSMLTEGGRLVSLCYDGVRQNRDLRPLADSWEVLPSGSFTEEGTRASVALLVINN